MRKRNIAEFMKVSRDRWCEDFETSIFNTDRVCYNEIIMPERKTVGSAGYDFHSPITFTLHPGESIKIPTGIRCKMKPNWVLMLHVRSSYGFKYEARLANTTGIIDADYFFADNEGHIMVKLVNDGNKAFTVKKGDAFVQGVFLEYGTAKEKKVTGKRKGGFGSTSEK